MPLGAALESREVLSSCLKEALEDPDLVDAISDQALEQGMSALTIGQGLVSVDQLKDKLYLTVEEAKSVLNICTSMVAGRSSLKQGSADQLSLRLHSTQSGSVALRVNVQQGGNAPTVAPSEEDTQQKQAVPFEPLDMIMDNAAVVVVSRTTPHTSEKKILVAPEPHISDPQVAELHPDPAPAPALAHPAAEVKDDSKPLEATAPKPVITKPASPCPTSAKSVEVPPAAVVLTSPKPAATVASPNPAATVASPNPAAVVASPKPAAVVAKPADGKLASTLPKPKTTKPGVHLPQEASAVSQRSPRSPPRASSPASAPSYLRPTFAHKARVSKEFDASASTSLTAPSGDSRKQRKRRSLFSRMASTLLAPTQAFVARVTGRSEEAKSKETPPARHSMHLETLLSSPQGQRVTKPQPFTLRSEMRVKSTVMSTEEMELAAAREKAFKRKPVPKHVYESRPIVPAQRSPPKEPSVVFEPFQLASLELHNKKMEEKRKKAEEEAAREEEARRFKARNFDPRIASSPFTPPKPAPSPPTRAEAPVFASEARISYHREVLEPAKKAKEAESNREKMEAELKAKELEEMNVEEYRKTLEFKARPMPDFSSPFRVDPLQSRTVTVPCEPKLHTVERLGAPVSRDDKDGDGIGKGVYDGAGYVDPFSASLRKSSSVSNPRLSIKSNASSRRNSALRQSASTAVVGPGAATPSGARSSMGSVLQAAIRAAARDAARDLAANGCSVTELPEEEEACSPGVTA